MKVLRKLATIALILVAGASLISCSKDDDNNNARGNNGGEGPGVSVVGEWFENSSAGNIKVLATSNYKDNGSVEFWLGYVESPNSLYYSFDGTYSLNDNAITQSYVSPLTGDNVKEVRNIVSVDKYTLVTSSSVTAEQTVEHRIVKNYLMGVGESQTFDISSYDAGFTASSYTSTDESIAAVSTTGTIKAGKRGTAYVCGISEAGTAVIRVVVTDPNNVIDDFMSFVGGSIDNVTKVYGNGYIEVPGTMIERTYGLLDETTEKVVFAYASNTVLMATAYLRLDADSEAIKASFAKKYTLYGDSKTTPVYSTIIDGQEYRITYFINDAVIAYAPYIELPPKEYNFSVESFKQYDNLIMMKKADAAAAAVGVTISEEDLLNGWFDITPSGNEVFNMVTVMFDEDPDSDEYMDITSVMMTTKSGIKQADIEEWYADNYTATGDPKNPYQSSTSPVYYISFKASGSRTIVNYKFRKNK